MKTTFKTALLAAAIATACSSAQAGTVNESIDSDIYSTEGTTSVESVTIEELTYKLGAAYTDNDTITFTFSAGAIADGFTFPSTLGAVAVPGSTPMGAPPVIAQAGVALGILSQSGDTVTYRVTSIDQPVGETDATTVGAVLLFESIEIDGAAVAAGDVTVAVESLALGNENIPFDTGTGNSAVLSENRTQFGEIAVGGGPGFDGEISVDSGRLSFTNGSEDTASWEIANVDDIEDFKELATVTETVVTLTADFDADAEAGDIEGAFTTYNSADVEYADGVVTFTYAGPVTTDTITFTPDELVLNKQTFTLSAEASYDDADDEAVDTAASYGNAPAGKWTLDGAEVNIPYMPYASVITQVIYVTNEGDQNAGVSYAAFDEAGNEYEGELGTVNAGSVLGVAGALKTSLSDQGLAVDTTSTAKKVSITITVNAKDEDISVVSQYNVNGDRANVLNSQYKGKETDLTEVLSELSPQ